MPALGKPAPMSVEEYLTGEQCTEIRHEFLAGDVYAMGGATDRHNIISLNIAAALHGQLRGGPCTVFINDMKVHLRFDQQDYFYYPDVMVACDPADNAPLYRDRPCVIIEVLSDSTERVDRREKLFAFRGIESLRHYVLVDQGKIEVTSYRRHEGEDWKTSILADPGDKLSLEAIGASIPLEDIYERSGV